MNCKSCGAALTPIPHRHYFYCEHCSSFHFPDDLPGSPDRITPLGKVVPARCPVCDVNLQLGRVEECSVHYCEKCRGFLVSCDDFAEIVRVRRARRPGLHGEATPLDPEELKRTIACPLCRRRMDVHPHYGPGSVVIDSCSRCHAVWLDRGEIAAIERAPGMR
jgi:Zn-finger nucleic acid-binding protein